MVIVWAVNFSLLKWALASMAPSVLNALRFSFAVCLILTLLIWREGWHPIPARDVLKFVGLGFLGFSIFQVLFFEGLARTTAGNASLFMATSPIITALLSVFLGRERLSPVIWEGIGLTTIGVILVSVGGGEEYSFMGTMIAGNALVLLATVSWSLYSVLSKDLLARYSPLRLTAIAMAAGSVGVWLFAIPEAIKQDWGSISWEAWGVVLYSGGLSLVAAHLIWAIGVKRIGPARTASFDNLSPVLTFIVAYFLLREQISWLRGLGAFVVLLGVTMVIRERKTHH